MGETMFLITGETMFPPWTPFFLPWPAWARLGLPAGEAGLRPLDAAPERTA
jgi:hypothetical protein